MNGVVVRTFLVKELRIRAIGNDLDLVPAVVQPHGLAMEVATGSRFVCPGVVMADGFFLQLFIGLCCCMLAQK